jgi:Na+/citrate or Na+/malate symporter
MESESSLRSHVLQRCTCTVEIEQNNDNNCTNNGTKQHVIVATVVVVVSFKLSELLNNAVNDLPLTSDSDLILSIFFLNLRNMVPVKSALVR